MRGAIEYGQPLRLRQCWKHKADKGRKQIQSDLLARSEVCSLRGFRQAAVSPTLSKPPFSFIFLAFCYIFLYEADSDAIPLRILL